MLEQILLRLKFWSFLALPSSGFFIGHILQFLLGTKHNAKYESLVVHIITMALMLVVFSDMTSETSQFSQMKDKATFLSILYLFILGVILGIISVIY